MEMYLQLHHILSDITGATGMRIIRLLSLAIAIPICRRLTTEDVRCHSSTEKIRTALVGNDRDEHLLALTEALELYGTYRPRCSTLIEAGFLDDGADDRGAKPIGA